MNEPPTPRTDAESEYVLSADMSGEIEIVRAPFARQLERELTEWQDKFDGSEITHAATRADLADCKLALEQERQDRVQAEKDVCRALGERNDARDELAASEYREGAFQVDLEKERALADRLAGCLSEALTGWDFDPEKVQVGREALAAWKEARRGSE